MIEGMYEKAHKAIRANPEHQSKKTKPNAEQRKKMMDYAIKTCRKKYGPTSRVFRMDYKYNRFYCYSY